MTNAPRAAIEQFLKDLRDGLDTRRFIPIDRRKNMRTLAQLGLTWEDVKDEMRSLCIEDYISGPSIDRDRPETDRLWVFKRIILDQVIYIKFKIEYQNDNDIRVISFHIDE